MCCEKHCIHERIIISLFMLTVFEKAPKIKCLPTKSTQKFSNLMIFILVKLYKSPKVTKIISKPPKPAIWYVTQCSFKKNMSHIVPFCRSHSSKAQYWQCGCLGDNSSNGSLYMVRGCIITFIFSLRRWIFKVFGNTFVSGCNVHGEGVLIFKNVSVYHKCKQYFFQLFFYMYSEVSNMKNKMNNKENTM